MCISVYLGGCGKKKFWHRRLIQWPWFPCKWRNFGDLRALSVDFLSEAEIVKHSVERDIQQLHNDQIVPITRTILRYFTVHARNGQISASDLRTFLVDFFSSEKQKVRHISTSGYLAYWPRKRATCWAAHVVHFHQVFSWYDYPSTSYSVVGVDTLCDLVTLTFWPWTVVKHGWSRGQPVHQVWRSYAYPFLTYVLWCPP